MYLLTIQLDQKGFAHPYLHLSESQNASDSLTGDLYSVSPDLEHEIDNKFEVRSNSLNSLDFRRGL